MSAARVVHVDASSPPSFEAPVRVLAQGGIVAHPTETLYGLAVDPWSEEAILRLDRVKGGEARSGYILIASSIEEALSIAARPWPPQLERLAGAFWPGPLTLVLPPSDHAPAGARAGSSGIAVRVTSDPVAAFLVRAFGRPLTSTSANPSGEPPARSASEVQTALGGMVDMILDGGRRDGTSPSTIVDLTTPEPSLIRVGAVSEARIRATLAGKTGSA